MWPVWCEHSGNSSYLVICALLAALMEPCFWTRFVDKHLILYSWPLSASLAGFACSRGCREVGSHKGKCKYSEKDSKGENRAQGWEGRKASGQEETSHHSHDTTYWSYKVLPWGMNFTGETQKFTPFHYELRKRQCPYGSRVSQDGPEQYKNGGSR